MSPTHMAEMFQIQASACHELGSPFYGVLLQRLAKDILADGPSAAVLAGHENDPGPSALALRLMGAVHFLVLTGEAETLAAHYPSTGGDGDPAGAWSALRDLLRSRPLELAAGLARPPQTNEVGRAAALFGALLQVAGPDPLPVRLHEIGCSGGLNLRADRFRYRSSDGGLWGPLSPVELDPAWQTMPPDAPRGLTVVERLGADLAPIDPTTAEGAARLASYVWADQTDRLQRLRDAVLVAQQWPAAVAVSDAGSFVEGMELVQGHLTVLWHSVVRQYLAAPERARLAAGIRRLGDRATESAPFAHIAFEPQRLTGNGVRRYLITAETWPRATDPDDADQVLGEAPAHGMTVSWGNPLPDAERPAPDGPQWPTRQ